MKSKMIDYEGVTKRKVVIPFEERKKLNKFKWMEKALQASEERFSCVFQYAPIGMATVTLEGSFIKVNASLCEILGYSETEFLALSLKDITYWAYLTVQCEKLQKLMVGELQTFRAEQRCVHKGGYLVWVLMNVSSVRDNQGLPQYFIVQLEDITERKSAEDALRQSEAKFRSYISQSLDGVHIIDDNGRYTEVNPAACLMLGYTREEMLQMSIGDIIAPGQTDGYDHFKNLIETGESMGEVTARRKDGTVITVEIHAVRLGENHNIGFVRDVTERKRSEEKILASEERFRTAFDYAPIGMALVSLDGAFLKVNHSLCKMLGYTERELLTKKFQDLTHSEDLMCSIENKQKMLNGETSNFWIEKKYYHKLGHPVYCLLSATLVRDNSGKPLYFVSQIQDITEQKVAVLALREREEMYRTLFEKSGNPILVIDKEGEYIDCNEEALRFLECERGELLNRNFWDTLPPDRLEMMEELTAVWDTRGTVEFEYWINGKIKVLELTVTPVLWQGKLAFIGIGRDITKQKEDEQSIRESEERYRRLVEFMPNTIVVTVDGVIVFVNFAGVKLLGATSVEELTGRPMTDFVHSDYRDALQRRMLKVTKGKAAPMEEERFIRLDGALIDVEVMAIPFSYQGKTAVQAVIRDITKNKLTEGALATEKERLAVTLRSIGEGVITADREGRIVLLNKVAESLTGWSSTEAIGKPLGAVFCPLNEKTREKCENSGQRVLQTGQRVGFGKPGILTAKDGTERIVIDSAQPICDNDSSIIGVVMVFRDITEQRKIEEEFIKVEKMESLGILAGGIAHDFNNILTVILGNISIGMMYAQSDTRINNQLKEIEKASMQARDLTKQLLTFAKGGAPIMKTYPIRELITETVNFVLRGSNVRCEFFLAGDLWAVEIDEGQISQVINNLIINAKQSMPEGGVLNVTAENVVIEEGDFISMKDERYVKITVKDQGIGISDENLPRIFDPYFTTKVKGSGLGLATSYSIIKNHNGYIKVQSTPGEGSSFFVFLPASNKSGLPTTDSDEKPVFGKGRILVMDDEDSIRQVVSSMLNHFGYEVVEARDGKEAVELYHQGHNSGRPYDVVIMDLTVPGGMGGKEAIRKLWEINPSVKAIVSSGYSNDPIMADYKQYGFAGVVAKPYKMVELSKAIHGVVNKP